MRVDTLRVQMCTFMKIVPRVLIDVSQVGKLVQGLTESKWHCSSNDPPKVARQSCRGNEVGAGNRNTCV